MTANSQETSVSSTESADDISVDTKSVGLPSPSLSFTPKQLTAINSFPWMAEFYKLCHKDMINPTARSLEKLMNFYHKNVSQSAKECYSRPVRCSKLKSNMGDLLIFFHMTYIDIKPPFEHSSYLAKMSDLMALYMDLEIKASRSGTESLPKIASKITSCLIVFFGRSHDYILDTIFKTKMIAKSSWELCDLIFRRVLRECPGSSAYVLTYIRYILAFKLWKAIMSCGEEKRKIQIVAETHLKLPPRFREKVSCCSVLRDILPRIPKARTDITKFLLEAKYVAQDKIKMFLKAVADPKLQCAIDRHNFASQNNSSISNEKEDNDHNLLMNDWSNMSLESDIGDSLLLNKIIYGSDNKKLHKLKNGLKSVGKNELKKKKKKMEISLEEIGEDDKDSSFEVAEDSAISIIKPEVEEIVKKDQINQVDSVCEGDTMEVAAEVELPSSPAEFTDFPTIKLEPQSSQSKENMVYPWGMPNMAPYYGHNGYDYGFDSKPDEFVAEKTSENTQTATFDSLSKHENDLSKGQTYETYPSVGDHSPSHGLGILPSEQVIMGTKSIDALRAQGILFEKCFPPGEISIPIEQRNSEIHSEEISAGEHSGELPLGEHNEEMSLGEVDVVNINPRIVGVCNEERSSEECINQSTSEINDVDRSSEHNRGTSSENNEIMCDKGGLIHDFTLRNDNKIYKFHVKVSSYLAKLNKRSWISLFYPLFSEQEIKTPRCPCNRCTHNYDILIKNWKTALLNISQLPDENGMYSDDLDKNIIKEMTNSLDECNGLKLLVWESETDEVDKKVEELIKEENEPSNLPLKKRKAFSYSSYVKDERSEMSYPNTPMISIAEVELAKEKYRFNAMNMNHPSTCNAPPPPINYMPDYISHPSYPNPADIKYDNVMVQSNITNIPSDQNPVPGAFTTTFIPEHQEQNRPKFKTPAQLKEFQHLSAAEDLINFSLTSRAYYNENQEPRRENEREKRKTRQKTKSSRKRKRAT